MMEEKVLGRNPRTDQGSLGARRLITKKHAGSS